MVSLSPQVDGKQAQVVPTDERSALACQPTAITPQLDRSPPLRRRQRNRTGAEILRDGYADGDDWTEKSGRNAQTKRRRGH